MREAIECGIGMASADRLLAQCRSAPTILGRVYSIEQLCELDTTEPGIQTPWRALGLAYLSRQYCWPLLSAEFGTFPFGLSLPVAVRVLRPVNGSARNVDFVCTFDNRVETFEVSEMGESTSYKFSKGALRWTPDFYRSFSTALGAAKSLWRSQRGIDRCEGIGATGAASLLVDWTFANEIASMPSPILSSVLLDGRSSEIYFAQVALAEMLGAPMPMAAATGTIKTSKEPLLLGWVEDIAPKARYARFCGIFSRQVVPSAAIGKLESDLKGQLADDLDSADMQINYCPSAVAAADVMQRTSWRRTVFLRSPEDQMHFFRRLPAWLRGRKTALASRQMEDRSRAWTNHWRSGVAAIEVDPAECRPDKVGDWLAWLHYWAQCAAGTNQAGPPLGVLSLRLASTDVDMRVWARLFETLDVNQALWRQFQWATLEQAQGILARVLNNFKCSQAVSSTPPPDLIVIVDEAGITRAPPERRFEDDFRGEFCDVLGPGLSERLKVRDDPRARILGKTRIMLFRPTARPPKSQRIELSADDQEYVQALTVFRAGFSEQAAAALLSVVQGEHDPVGVRALLIRLSQIGVLGRYRDHYFITWSWRAGWPLPRRSPEEHLRVAAALAPILEPTEKLAAGNRDDLFEGWAIDDALWHLREAAATCPKRKIELSRRISGSTLTVLSLMPAPDWDLVRPLRAVGGDRGTEALDLVKELVAAECDVRHPSGARIHSSRYALALNVVGFRIGGVKSEQGRKDLLGLARQWLTEGMEAIGEDPGGAQSIRLLSEFAYCLGQAGDSDPDRMKERVEIEARLDTSLSAYRESGANQGHPPLSRSYVRDCILNRKRELSARYQSARVACALGKGRREDGCLEWSDPWYFALSMMAPESGVTRDEVEALLIGMNGAEDQSCAPMVAMTREIRRNAAWADYRARIGAAVFALCRWLTHPKTPLQGRSEELAWAITREWCSESATCYQLASHFSVSRLLELALHLGASPARRPDPIKLRLGRILFSDTWAWWALLSRLVGSHATSANEDVVAAALAKISPKVRCDEGLAVFAPDEHDLGTSCEYARIDSLKWLSTAKRSRGLPTAIKLLQQSSGSIYAAPVRTRPGIEVEPRHARFSKKRSDAEGRPG